MQRIPAFKSLDVFRGFAALWVVMVHCCDRWLSAGNDAYLHVPLYAFAIRGQLGVMLFFVISGYCIAAACYAALISDKSIWRYSYERVRRIYPPYLAALLLGVLSTLAISFANSHHLIGEVHHLAELPRGFKSWFANIFLLQSELNTPMMNVVFWSLGFEIAFYAILGAFLQGAKFLKARISHAAGTLFFVCATGISTVIGLAWMIAYGTVIFPFTGWHQFSIGALLFFLIEFNSKTVAGYSNRFRWILRANILAVTVAILLFAALRQVGEIDIGHPSSRIRSVVCLLFAAALVGLRRIDDKLASNRLLHPFMWVGAFSYSLYLVHPIVVPYVDILTRKVGLDGHLYWISFWLQLATAVVFGRIFFLLIERHFISKRQVSRLTAEHVA